MFYRCFVKELKIGLSRPFHFEKFEKISSHQTFCIAYKYKQKLGNYFSNF